MSDIDNLEVKITSTTDGADEGIDKLVSSLVNLDKQLGGMSNVKAFTNAMNNMSGSFSAIQNTVNHFDVSKVSQSLQGIDDVSKRAARGLAKNFNVTSRTGINEITESIKRLYENLGNDVAVEAEKANIRSLVQEYTKLGREADEVYKQVRAYVSKTPVPIPSDMKSNFGDDWKDIQRTLHNTTDAKGAGQDTVGYLEEMRGVLGGIVPEAQNSAEAIRWLYDTLKSGKNLGDGMSKDVDFLEALDTEIDKVVQSAQGMSAPFTQFGNEAVQSVKKASKETESLTSFIERVQKEDWTKYFTIKSNLPDLEKQLKNLKEAYNKTVRNAQNIAFNNQGTLPDTAKTREIIKLQAEYKQQIEAVRAKIKELEKSSSQVKVDKVVDTQAIRTNITEAITPLQNFKNNILEVFSALEDGIMSDSVLDTLITNVKADFEDLKSYYPDAKSTIDDYKKAIEDLENASSGSSRKIDWQAHFAKFDGQIPSADRTLEAVEKLGISTDEYVDAWQRGVDLLEEAGRATETIAQDTEQLGDSTEGTEQKYHGVLGLVDRYLDKMKELGGGSRIKPEVDDSEFNSKIQDIINKLNNAKETIKNMESGKTPFDSAVYEQAQRDIASAKDELDKYKQTLSETSNATSEARATTSAFLSILRGVGSFGLKAFKGFGQGLVNTIQKPLKSISAHLDRMHSKMGRLLKTFNLMLVRRFLYAIITGFRDAIDSLTQFTGAIGKEFNQSMSLITSDFRWVGGNIIAAFAPILNTVIPIIDKLISKLVEAITWINKFVSSLLGKSSYVTATKKVTDYAASLDKAGKSAKKLRDYTLGIDELNIFNEDDSSSGGGASDADAGLYEWEEHPLDFEWDWESLKERAEELGRALADALNNIFSDMELARKIGTAIAELLNVALHFVYGFVDELNWKQMGKWLGELVYTGVTTFEWDLLGKTIGLLLNGIADTIIGFFENYPAGTIGESLATMFNNAIDTIRPVDIGKAIGDILGAPLAELISFVDNANIEKAGESFGLIIKSIISEPLLNGDRTLGTLIGEGLASIVNAGIDLLIGADIAGAVSAIGQFFSDILVAAVENIHWIKLAEAIGMSCADLLAMLAYNLAGLLATSLYNVLYTALDVIYLFSPELADSLRKTLDDAVEDTQDILDKGMEYYETYRNVITDGLEKIAEASGESNETIKTNNNEIAQNLDETGTAYENYSTRAVNAQHGIERSVTEGKGIVKQATGEMTTDLNIATDSLNKTTDEVPKYIKTMDDVSTTASNTTSAVSDMNIDVTSTLESINETMQEWYDNMVQTYFSYDGWTTIFAEGILLPLEEFFVLWNEYWNENLLLWQEESLLPYFSEETWLTLADGMRLGIENKWTQFTKEWKVNFKKWWDIEIVPYFSLKQWTEFGNNIRKGIMDEWYAFREDWSKSFTEWWTKDVSPFFQIEVWTKFGSNMREGIYGGFRAIVQDVAGIMNGLVDVLNEAMSGVESSMNDLIDDYNSVADIIGGPTVPNVSYSPAPKVTIPAFADGGYPEIGSLFFAGEAGAEMVGSVDGKTGVVSNEEITGIREAVAASGSQSAQLLTQIIAIAQELLDKDPVVLGDREIAEASNRGQGLLGYAIIS